MEFMMNTVRSGRGERRRWSGEPPDFDGVLGVGHRDELVIPRSMLRGQSFLVPTGVWRTRGMMQLERGRTVHGQSTTTLSPP